MAPKHREAGPLRAPYLNLKKLAKRDYGGAETGEQIIDLVRVSLTYLAEMAAPIDLISKVPGKNYFAFASKAGQSGTSSPINRDLFNPDHAAIEAGWRAWRVGNPPMGLSTLIYTMASSYRAASELFDRQNRKGPATYFETLIGHLFARELGVNPEKTVAIPILGRNVRLTMDFLFSPGEGTPHVHLPVKMSTRERVVQAWAHQRILDACYGHAAYRAILVAFSETKLDSRTLEVIEITVPNQWLAYQKYLARMDRIYYFDIPAKYAALAAEFPIFQLKQFGEFFSEREVVLASPLA